jgi:hypothetical protein
VRRSRQLAAVLAAVLAAAVGGCGSSQEKEPLAPGDAVALTRLLADAREAGAQDDPDGTRAALREFRRKVRALERGGRIDALDAEALREGARQAEARVSADVDTPPLPIEPAPAPAPAEPAPPPEPPGKEKGPKKDKGGDKGGGKDEDDEEGDGDD